jgi:hypothetical protein
MAELEGSTRRPALEGPLTILLSWAFTHTIFAPRVERPRDDAASLERLYDHGNSVLDRSYGAERSPSVELWRCHSLDRYTYSQFPIIYYTWVTIQFNESHFDMGDRVCSDGIRCGVPLHRLHSYAYLLQLQTLLG